MRYLSVCSGIEAASVAWHDLGWQPIGFSEIEKFPSQVLEARFPGVRNYGDMTKFREWDIERGTVDILVGGTPCQAFSVAGLRRGLEDPRGNLALTFVAMVDWYRPEWVVWENVPGVLSSNGGRDFGAFLGALGQLGYGWSYRILDAQYFGVAQRRRRVFVVAHASGDPRRASEVLFEPESLRGDPPPSREAGQGIASGAGEGFVGGGCWWDGGQVSQTLDAVLTQYQTMPEKNRFPAVLQPSLYESHPNDSRVTGPVEQCPTVAARGGTGGNNTPLVQQPIGLDPEHNAIVDGYGTLRAHTSGGFEGNVAVPVQQPMCLMDQGGSVMQVNTDGTTGTLRRETHGHEPVVVVQQPIAFSPKEGGFGSPAIDMVPALCVDRGANVVAVQQPMAFSWQSRGDMRGAKPRPTAQLQRCQVEAVLTPMAVRRLTPVECERLQGFPDGWTDIKPGGKDTPDSPRYKALGNSMAVPVMAWIGRRIEAHK